MVPFFAERAAKKGYSLYFLGAAPEVARRATDILKENNPGLNIVGMASPYWKPDEEMDPAIIADIKAAKPDVLFVAFGNPKQELWIEKYGKEVGVPVMMGIGATLDFIAGKTQRAPRWMQKTGLEWAMRLIQEPKRLWKRYAVGMLVFAPQLLRQWWTMRNQNHDAQLLKISSQKMGDLTTITLQGRVDITSYRIVYREGQTAITARPRLIINMAQVDRLDCLGIATLMELAKQTRDAGGDLRLISLPDKLYRLFSQIGILGFFRLEDTGEYANGWLTDRLVGRRA
ncbi:MAG: WecB/TagA/CpsF family glycosyltransferase, partial [Methylococcales bacterium]|nr:WecB/TagA/CpsF family glycosyltransferase [Methylococcales bacterium]